MLSAFASAGLDKASAGNDKVVTMLMVGLGNPGTEYARQRHNVGFMIIDALAQHFRAASFQSKFRGQLSDIRIENQKVFLLKPQTFMNLSGRSVSDAVAFYKIPTEHVFVIHDDLDLPAGHVRMKLGGGHGGHNGLKSLDESIGPNYWRVRVGIGHPGQKHLVTPYVLGNLSPEDALWLENLERAIVTHCHLLLTDPQLFVTRLAEGRPSTK